LALAYGHKTWVQKLDGDALDLTVRIQESSGCSALIEEHMEINLSVIKEMGLKVN